MSSWKLFVDEVGTPVPYPGRSILGKAPVLLASVDSGGNLRYISISWKAILGFAPEWETSRPLHELIEGERTVADAVIAALLDRGTTKPVEFDLRCSDGAIRRYVWHRRYDAEEELMYIAGEEVAAGGPAAPAR
jgi:PAS domain-containing protein